MTDSSTNPVPAAEPERSGALPAAAMQTALSTFVQPGYGGFQEQEQSINLREYWLIIVKRKWTVISLFLMVIIIAIIATFLTTPIYRATTILQIEREAVKVVEFQEVNPSDSGGADFYQTQYELLKSRSLAERVVDQLGLARQPVAIPRKDASLMEWFSEIVDGREASQPPPVTSTAQPSSQEERRLAQAGALLGSLTVEPIRSSRLVRVSYESTDPVMAAKVANAIAQNFINVNMERKFDATSYAKTFLEERISQVKQRLEEAERAMNEYARDNEIVNLGGEQGGTTASRNLEGFNAALAQAQQERIKAESLYRQLQAAHGGELPQVLESSIIKSLRESKVKLESEYQDKLGTFKPGYPAMLELKNRIAEIDIQITKEKKVVGDSIRATYEAAKAHEAMIAERFNTSRDEVLDLQTAGIEYSILKREADTNRELYDGLLQRYKEVGVAGGVGNNNISVVDKAEIPKSYYKPDIKMNLLIAVVIGLFGGIGLAFLFEHLDDTFKRSVDVENLLGLPVIGLIPESVEMNDGASVVQVSLDDPRSAVVEAYRSVRTALQFSGESGAPQLMALTSSEKGEAKTTSAVGIGIQFAQFGSKVLIIDADLRNPSLHKVFGGDNLHGLTNVLAGGESPSKVTHNTPVSNLYFMSSGPLPPNPAELLSCNKMKQLLEVARGKFDYIIIDSPPILGLADVLVIANLADAVILEIHSGATRRATVQAALRRLTAVRIKPLGCMLTRMRHGIHGYGYSYEDYYTYGTKSEDYGAAVSARLKA
jgi:capsular exopolysaccharide family